MAVGLVRLFSKNGTDWYMLQQIEGSVDHKHIGKSVDLSYDGSTLAFSSFYGAVHIYDFNKTSSKYYHFHTTDDLDADEVSLSGDGSTVGFTPMSSAKNR